MAVSSGIFAVPEGMRCDHFVTLDEPKYYMAQLMSQSEHSWGNDGRSRPWKFWTDPAIIKHVVTGRIRTVEHLPLSIPAILKCIKMWGERGKVPNSELSEIKERFFEELGIGLIGHFGFQPGWGDYQNVRGWGVHNRVHPAWFGDGKLSVHRAFNSLLMAVQVATRLGFNELRFAGVDLNEDHYKDLRVILSRWHTHARRRGINWINLSPGSALAQFVPTRNLQPMEIAA